DNANAPTQYGFIAQDVQAQFPNLVKEGTWIDGSQKLFLSMGGLMPYTVAAIKELNLNLESIAGTVTPIPDSSQPFVTAFFDNLFNKISAWLADAGNGIARIFAGEVDTKTLCVSDDSGAKTCLTKA